MSTYEILHGDDRKKTMKRQSPSGPFLPACAFL